MKISKIRIPVGVKHSVWSVIDAAIYPAVYLGLVPLLLRVMGAEEFGLWILLNTMMIVLQALNLNLGTTALKTVSQYHAENNPGKVNASINALFQITVVLLLLALLIGLGPGYIAVKKGWWGLGNTGLADIFLCVVITAIIAGIRFLDQVCQNIIKARERFKTASILNMTNRFGLLTITCTLAVLKYSILIILWGNLVYISCYIVLQLVVIHRIFPEYRITFIEKTDTYKGLLRFSVWPWLQTIIIILTFQTDRFWVARFAGLKEVSSYGLVSTMFNHINLIFTAMALWMMPRIAAMTTKGQDPSVLYRQVRGVLFGIILFSLVMFYLVAPLIFELWIGRETYLQMEPYIGAFIAFEIVFTHTILPFFYLNAAGKERLATVLTFIYSAAAYICMIGGLYIFQNTVALVQGMTLSLCITMPVINAVTGKMMLGTTSWKNAVLEMVPMYAAVLLINTQNTWLRLFLGIIMIGMFWKYYLTDVIKPDLWKQIL